MSSPRLRLDRSRPYATVHGERAPGDPHQTTHFAQDGIHFDAQGLHIDELIDNDKIRAKVDQRLKKQAKVASKDAGEATADADDDDDGSDQPSSDNAEDVNLEAWLRGEAKYQWFAITKTMRNRYHQNLTKLVDVLEFLVFDMKVVPEADLSQELKGQLRKN